MSILLLGTHRKPYQNYAASAYSWDAKLSFAFTFLTYKAVNPQLSISLEHQSNLFRPLTRNYLGWWRRGVSHPSPVYFHSTSTSRLLYIPYVTLVVKFSLYSIDRFYEFVVKFKWFAWTDCIPNHHTYQIYEPQYKWYV